MIASPNQTQTPQARAVRLSPSPLADPFEILFACDGNEALAAEQLGVSVPEFFRMLENANPERVAKGLNIRMAVTLSRLISTVEGRIIDRLNDEDNPPSDRVLVELLTRGIPALTDLTTRGTSSPNPNGGADVPPAIQRILDKLGAATAPPSLPRTIMAGDAE